MWTLVLPLFGMLVQVPTTPASDQEIVQKIITRCDEHVQAQSNLLIEVEVRRGSPPDYLFQDDYEIKVLGDWCVAYLRDRLKSGKVPPIGSPRIRVGVFTEEYAYVLKKDDPERDFRVEGVVLDKSRTLKMGERFAWAWWLASASYTVDGLRVDEILKNNHGVTVRRVVKDNRKVVILALKPNESLFPYPVAELEITVDEEWLAVAGWRYVHTYTDPAGHQTHNLRTRQHTLKKWPEAGDMVFPVTTFDESVTLSAPRLDASPLTEVVPYESTVQSLRHGKVSAADFLPSAFGISDSIVSFNRPRLSGAAIMLPEYVDLGEVAENVELNPEIAIHNSSGRTIRCIGIPSRCDLGCVEAPQIPFSIKPGETHVTRLKFSTPAVEWLRHRGITTNIASESVDLYFDHPRHAKETVQLKYSVRGDDESP